jgi:hypothetical protein
MSYTTTNVMISFPEAGIVNLEFNGWSWNFPIKALTDVINNAQPDPGHLLRNIGASIALQNIDPSDTAGISTYVNNTLYKY